MMEERNKESMEEREQRRNTKRCRRSEKVTKGEAVKREICWIKFIFVLDSFKEETVYRNALRR